MINEISVLYAEQYIIIIKYTSLTFNDIVSVPCSVGNYLNNTDPYNPGCYDCPKGTYKDNVDTLKCSQCPTGTSTLKEASTSNDQCIGICGE